MPFRASADRCPARTCRRPGLADGEFDKLITAGRPRAHAAIWRDPQAGACRGEVRGRRGRSRRARRDRRQAAALLGGLRHDRQLAVPHHQGRRHSPSSPSMTGSNAASRDDGSGWLLEKVSGSQRTKGRFFDDADKRLDLSRLILRRWRPDHALWQRSRQRPVRLRLPHRRRSMADRVPGAALRIETRHPRVSEIARSDTSDRPVIKRLMSDGPVRLRLGLRPGIALPSSDMKLECAVSRTARSRRVGNGRGSRAGCPSCSQSFPRKPTGRCRSPDDPRRPRRPQLRRADRVLRRAQHDPDAAALLGRSSACRCLSSPPR